MENNLESLSCKLCSKSFKYKSKLIRHKLVHSKIKSFKCAYCTKSFALKYNLSVHIRIHLGIKPYKCTVDGCGKSFAQSNNLTVHKKTHNISSVYPPAFFLHFQQRLQQKIDSIYTQTPVEVDFETETAMSEEDMPTDY